MAEVPCVALVQLGQNPWVISAPVIIVCWTRTSESQVQPRLMGRTRQRETVHFRPFTSVLGLQGVP